MKTNYMIYLFSLILVGIVIFVIFSSNKPAQQDGQIKWTTYTNTKYDYKIDYPKDWITEIDGVVMWDDQVPNPELGDVIMFYKDILQPDGRTLIYRIRFFVSGNSNFANIPLKDWFIDKCLQFIDFPPQNPEEFCQNSYENSVRATIGGYESLKDGDSIFINKPPTIISIVYSVEEFGGSVSPTPKDIFDQMVSSFSSI